MTQHYHRLNSSFRDPSGFLFVSKDTLYRQVNRSYQKNFDLLIESGLYEKLANKKLLVHHKKVDVDFLDTSNGYCVIQPQLIPFISYPYEWSFSQLKDAALLTLEVQKEALEHKMTLKDASSYNIQFIGSKPIFIDTLSFEKYQEGLPWVAYKQFCQHFLAPLALMAYRDTRLNSLLRNYIDGIPLDLAARLLPFQARFNFGLTSHIFLHSSAQKQFADKEIQNAKNNRSFSCMAFYGLIDSLETTIRKLTRKDENTEWADYYESTNYSQTAFDAKKELVSEYISKIKPTIVWDMGANTGEFSAIADQASCQTIAFDIDSGAVEKHYLECRKKQTKYTLPLCLDLTNPSPAIGWHNQERQSLIERAPADMVLALALIHHLAISNNVPFAALASFFSDIGKWLIIEFVPKTDSQVQRLLKSRLDIFDDYDQEHFEGVMQHNFVIKDTRPIADSQRTLYLMERK